MPVNYPFNLIAFMVAYCPGIKIVRTPGTWELAAYGQKFTLIDGVDRVLIAPHIDDGVNVTLQTNTDVAAWQMSILIMPCVQATRFIQEVSSKHVAEGNENG